jgi:hypothetical protein
MKNVIVSLIALAALSGVAFADDASNGYSGHNATDALIFAAPSNTIINKAAVSYDVQTAKKVTLGNEAGNGYASHNFQ